MINRRSQLILLFLFVASFSFSQTNNVRFSFSFGDEGLNRVTDGRIILILSKTISKNLRYRTGPNKSIHSFGTNISIDHRSAKINSNDFATFSNQEFSKLSPGKYYAQVIFDYNKIASSIHTPGNLYSEIFSIDLPSDNTIRVSIEQINTSSEVQDDKWVQYNTMKSEILSNWWNRDVNLHVGILLPSGYYDNPEKTYPVRYNIAGYGGRYTRVSRHLRDTTFMDWWLSDSAPQIISIYLDGEGPLGDPYQIDSENHGPYGKALIEELIPLLEQKYRGNGTRYTDGCSTGGWVSFALQVFYPTTFDGCWSYSADPVDFNHMQLINIYEEDNAFVNSYGYLKPSRRSRTGEPTFSIKHEVYSENVTGWNDTYTTSGNQWGSWNAVYGSKGDNGEPRPLFDPWTGEIDSTESEHWKKYDLKLHLENNWAEIGKDLTGKITVWMGDMDNYYLNNAMRNMEDFLDETKNPPANATLNFSAQKGHCDDYDTREVLEMMWNKLSKDLSKK